MGASGPAWRTQCPLLLVLRRSSVPRPNVHSTPATPLSLLQLHHLQQLKLRLPLQLHHYAALRSVTTTPSTTTTTTTTTTTPSCCLAFCNNYTINNYNYEYNYNYTIMLPCVLLSCLTTVIFWLPPESPAKIMLGSCHGCRCQARANLLLELNAKTLLSLDNGVTGSRASAPY